MARSVVTYTGDGSTTDFIVTFPYIKEAHIKVYVDDVLQTLTTNYTFDSGTKTISFVTAPASATAVKLQRETERDETLRPVIFTANADLAHGDLNKSDLYIIYLVQEALDQISGDAGDDLSNQLATKADKDGANVTDPATFRSNLVVYSQTEVVNQILQGRWQVRRITGSTTLLSTDKVITIDGSGSSSDIDITLPEAPSNGTMYLLKKINAPDPSGVINVLPSGSDTSEATNPILTSASEALLLIYETTATKWHVIGKYLGS